MEPRLHVFRQGDGQKFLYYNEITKESGLQENTVDQPAANTESTVPPKVIPIFAPIPIEAATVMPPATDPGTPVQILPTSSFSDPSIEIDYYGIHCKALYSLLSSTRNMMSQAKLTTEAYQYYSNKVAQMQTAYDTRGCRIGLDVIDPTNVTPSTSTNNATTPVLSTDSIIGTPVVTVLDNSNTTTSPGTPLAAGAPTGGGGGGGGGGGSSAAASTPAARKKPDFKKDWLWWLLAATAVGISIYQGRNTELKFSGK